MPNELYRTYEVLVEESVHPDHPKRAKDKTNKPSRFNAEIDGALRDTHMIFQDAVCYNTLCFAGLAGMERHKSGERAGGLLNPLWQHLTTPASKGGIKEETEKVIRRLATHYKPLADITIADEFLNRVYSEPLRINSGMTEAERKAVLDLRARCYRILEMFGAPQKDNGGQECADMSAFANTWAGLTSKPESDTEIPGNLAYDCVSRELQAKLTDEMNEKEVVEVLEKTLLRYSQVAEERNKKDSEQKYLEELEELKNAICVAEKLPDTNETKARKIRSAKGVAEEFEKEKDQFIKKFFENRRTGLGRAVVSALGKPFATEKASDLGLSEAEFSAAKQHIARIAVATETIDKQHIRLHYKGGNPNNFEKAIFRYWLLRNDETSLDGNGKKTVKAAALADFRNFIKNDKPEKEPKLDEKHIAAMPFTAKGAKFAFQLFGKLCLGIETIHSSPDWAFDKTAYATAAEDVFKYKIRTDTRKVKVAKLLNVVQAYENKGTSLTAEESPTGKRLTVRGMDGDPRWKEDKEDCKGVVRLLAKMSQDKEISGYGLRAGTIGGWAEVRKALLGVYRKATKNGRDVNETQLTTDLEKAVDDEMEANRQGFGSADFFHELCEPAFFHLWLEDKEKDNEKDKDGNVIQKFEHNGIKDFIPHYVSYCEWREKLISLLMQDGGELEWKSEVELPATELRKLANRPIRYTWPGLLNRHKKPSYRYFDFAENLNTSLQLKSLFRRVRTESDPHGVPIYKKLDGDDAKLTLAARRLKRDKIVNKDTGNSVDALWCPPLILAGESEPTKEKYPRAGKYEDGKAKTWTKGDAEVSFSLIASPLPGDYWNEVAGVPSASEKYPVHMTVSFKLEANALALLQNEGVHFIRKSLKGVGEEDDKREFFRWPVDIETDRVAAQEAAAKDKKEAEKTGKPPKKQTRKPDVKPDELWCNYANGFLVKESRYIKAERTKRVPEFHLLSIDLGNRFAAAFTRLRIHADPKSDGRVVSAEGFLPVIKAQSVRQGKLCLQGEGADVWRLVSEKNKEHIATKLRAQGIKRDPVVGQYDLVEEAYGNGGRGRFPTDLEYKQQFVPVAEHLVPVSSLSLAGTNKQTYPELGDHLIFRLKRRIGRLRTLLNLIWRLRGTHERNNNIGKHDKQREDKDWLFHRRMTVETLARSKFPKRPRQEGEVEEPNDASLRASLASDDQWQKLKEHGLLDSVKGAAEKKRRQDLENALKQLGVWNWDKLADAVKNQIEENFSGNDSLDKLLVDVIEFCLPLRGRHWGWDRSRKARLHWDKKDETHNPNIQGMRGLSLKRLEQILNLRQRCQSFAKLEDRYHRQFKLKNYNPPDSIARELIEDVCPLLLERSNRIRDQRVEQTAHLILAEALGMELKNPSEVVNKKARKMAVDLHGEYKRRKDKNRRDYPRCSVIVLENLERYKTSQERTKTENSRLMQWAHRAIIEKLEDMCRPFGITLMLVDPAFSSHFDARTGLPGVRMNQVSPGFHEQYPYNKWVNDKTKTGKQTQLAKDIEAVKKLFADNPDFKGDLILAVEGGKEFLPVLSPDGGEGLINADICAAGNVGLRGVADPLRWDIFPRLRTKQISETEVSVTNWRGWFGKYLNDAEERRMRALATETAPAKAAATEKKKRRNSATNANESESPDSSDSQSGESSEFPAFFVAHPNHDWGIGLRDRAYRFVQNGKEILTYPQSAYLKRVEKVCSEHIIRINQDRIHKPPKA